MPCVAGMSGKTPGRGQSINKPSAEFVLRCKECDGAYPARKILKDEGNAKRKSKKKDCRRPCHVYNHKTVYYCFGCRRYLCFGAPTRGKGKDGKKYPKQFTIRVPKLEEDGSVVRDADKNVVFVEEYGELTCWHIAHENNWRESLENGSKTTTVSEEKAAVSEEKKSAEDARKSKRKKKSGN